MRNYWIDTQYLRLESVGEIPLTGGADGSDGKYAYRRRNHYVCQTGNCNITLHRLQQLFIVNSLDWSFSHVFFSKCRFFFRKMT